ncbi:hypothetical protein STSP2_00629 [Anaerohalosphaera lusitana]|uniref:Uncharacterized protein n=1 Tax=Anaerohalosphaera lusitana TaxID=1936003 RepID=A0A1U9NHR5_9BACT|nr:hypothetical protein STSP2_00629 [Anaerohalosphaera lusitana]
MISLAGFGVVGKLFVWNGCFGWFGVVSVGEMVIMRGLGAGFERLSVFLIVMDSVFRFLGIY